MDHDTVRILLGRMLFTSIRYPADYGFVTGALAEDSDPPSSGKGTTLGVTPASRPKGRPSKLSRARRM